MALALGLKAVVIGLSDVQWAFKATDITEYNQSSPNPVLLAQMPSNMLPRTLHCWKHERIRIDALESTSGAVALGVTRLEL